MDVCDTKRTPLGKRKRSRKHQLKEARNKKRLDQEWVGFEAATVGIHASNEHRRRRESWKASLRGSNQPKASVRGCNQPMLVKSTIKRRDVCLKFVSLMIFWGGFPCPNLDFQQIGAFNALALSSAVSSSSLESVSVSPSSPPSSSPESISTI